MKTQAIARRNPGIDSFRFVASLFVILIHATPPGVTGSALNCIARCGVLGFFAISGFFSVNADRRRLEKRMKSILWLNLWGMALVLAWRCVATELYLTSGLPYGGSFVACLRRAIPSLGQWYAWLALCLNPVSEPLWFLMALLQCYGIVWLCLGFTGKTAGELTGLYLAGPLLFLLYQLLGPVSASAGGAVLGLPLRSTWLLGFPMFSMGLFLGQYRRRLWENFSLTAGKLLAVIALGFGLALTEWFQVGFFDAPAGCVLALMALLLLLDRYPMGNERIAGYLGRLSTWVYLTHSVVITMAEDLAPDLAGWPKTGVVLAGSLAASAAMEALETILKRK